MSQLDASANHLETSNPILNPEGGAPTQANDNYVFYSPGEDPNVKISGGPGKYVMLDPGEGMKIFDDGLKGNGPRVQSTDFLGVNGKLVGLRHDVAERVFGEDEMRSRTVIEIGENNDSTPQ